jgi:3-mercaptopyruvate sulfurtransferase SseA
MPQPRHTSRHIQPYILTVCFAACGDAFALTLPGAKNVAVYDGSLVDWSSRPELPMETGPG